jgi:hypothetical protein
MKKYAIIKSIVVNGQMKSWALMFIKANDFSHAISKALRLFNSYENMQGGLVYDDDYFMGISNKDIDKPFVHWDINAV